MKIAYITLQQTSASVLVSLVMKPEPPNISNPVLFAREIKTWEQMRDLGWEITDEYSICGVVDHNNIVQQGEELSNMELAEIFVTDMLVKTK